VFGVVAVVVCGVCVGCGVGVVDGDCVVGVCVVIGGVGDTGVGFVDHDGFVGVGVVIGGSDVVVIVVCMLHGTVVLYDVANSVVDICICCGVVAAVVLVVACYVGNAGVVGVIDRCAYIVGVVAVVCGVVVVVDSCVDIVDVCYDAGVAVWLTVFYVVVVYVDVVDAVDVVVVDDLCVANGVVVVFFLYAAVLVYVCCC